MLQMVKHIMYAIIEIMEWQSVKQTGHVTGQCSNVMQQSVKDDQ